MLGRIVLFCLLLGVPGQDWDESDSELTLSLNLFDFSSSHLTVLLVVLLTLGLIGLL